MDDVPKLVNTPVRRLGTMRRRSSPMTSLQRQSNSTPTTPVNISKPLKRSLLTESEDLEVTTLTPSKMLKSLQDISNSITAPPQTFSERENYLEELEKKLESLNNCEELDRDVKMWRAGCRDALLELQTLISKQEGKEVSCKTLSRQLGIFSVIKSRFEGDSELIMSDDESDS